MKQLRKENTQMHFVREKCEWFLFDASGKTLGRMASEMAKILRGKHRPQFTPNEDLGDGIVIINAEKIKVTGAKSMQKVYRHHTGYPAGMREVPFEVMLARKPDHIIRHAIWGMMPKTKLSRKQMKRLRIFRGENHDLSSQKPITISTG